MTVARPTTLDEALEALAELDATIVAGGTDVMVEAGAGQRALGDVVAVRRVAELQRVDVSAGRVRLGAGLSYASLTGVAGMPRKAAPALFTAAASMGSTQIRAMGTLGGNVVTASPVGDSLCALLALDAVATVARPGSAREVLLHDLIGADGCALAGNELLVDLSFPAATGFQRFLKVCRRAAVSRSVVSASVVCQPGGPGAGAVRIVIGGCAMRPARLRGAEQVARELWNGDGFLTAEAAAEVAAAVSVELHPPDDLRGSSEYRSHVAGVLVRRALAGEGAERRPA